jgi:hypothetical protein
MRFHAFNAAVKPRFLDSPKEKARSMAGPIRLSAAYPAGAVLPTPAGNPIPVVLGRAALHIDALANRTLVINRHPALLHVNRRRRRRSPVDDRRLGLSHSRTDGGPHGKTSQSPESDGCAGRQAIARCGRFGNSQAGNQRQSRGGTGNKTEDLHDHHLDRREAPCLPLHVMRYTVRNLSES